ncbi:MAG: NAD-dependent epimerase/dehydratase family protein [Candidatus Schekmanbacteria bacterium]|nr:NAD-dependent epimerase/dehydratase family protein [Candidatus Schekmanbacteria bacterium]
MNKIYLTGAGGFIGSRFLEFMVKTGFAGEIICPVRGDYAFKVNEINKSANFYSADLNDKDSVARGMKGCDTVFHFAAKASMRKGKGTYSTNVIGTKNIVDAANDSGSVKKIIFLSTIWAVDRSPYDTCSVPLDDDSECIPSTAYGRSKYEGELIIKKSGIPYVIFRLPPVYGPGSKPNYFVSRLILGIKNSNPLYRIAFPAKISLLYIDDIVEACYLSGMKDDIRNGAFFLSSSNAVSISDIIKEIIKELGLSTAPLDINEGLVKLLKSAFCSKALRHIVPPEWKSIILDYLVCDSSGFKKVSGFQPSVDMKEGICETVKWYRESGWPQ